MDKRIVMLGMIVGSTIGGWLPSYIGIDPLSFTGILFTLVGGLLGIWVAVKLSGD